MDPSIKLNHNFKCGGTTYTVNSFTTDAWAVNGADSTFPYCKDPAPATGTQVEYVQFVSKEDADHKVVIVPAYKVVSTGGYFACGTLARQEYRPRGLTSDCDLA